MIIIQVNATTSGAYNIIRCENPTNCCIIQVFAPNDYCRYKPKILFINKIFADLFGLHENEEVILLHSCHYVEIVFSKYFHKSSCHYDSEIDLFWINLQVIVQKIKTAPICSSFEVELASARDWDVVVCFIVQKKLGNTDFDINLARRKFHFYVFI